MDTRAMAREVRLNYWTGILQGRAESGQTVRGYCEANGINEKSYYYWQRRLREAACETLSVQRGEMSRLPDTTFAEVPLQTARVLNATVVVRMGEVAVEIPSGADPATVEAVLRAVSVLC